MRWFLGGVAVVLLTMNMGDDDTENYTQDVYDPRAACEAKVRDMEAAGAVSELNRIYNVQMCMEMSQG